MLDLVPPRPDQLREAAAAIESGRSAGPVLVCCALGYSRSACVVATWLALYGGAGSVSNAVEQIRHARPRIVLGHEALAAINAAVGTVP